MRIVLSDDSSYEILSDVLQDSGLGRGDRLSVTEAESLRLKSETTGAERKALALLSRAPHTRQGLRRKLLQRGFDTTATDRALARMDELEYLDDISFAKNWLISRLDRHPEGRYALLAGLQNRGIARDVAENLLRNEVTEEVELDLARRAARKMGSGTPLTPQQVSRKLSNRGFGSAVIRRLLGEWPNLSDG